MLRDAQAGTLGQGIADERPIQVGGAGSTHAAVARFVWLRQFEPRSNSADANRLLDRRESHEIAPHGSESVRAAGPAGIQPRRGPGAYGRAPASGRTVLDDGGITSQIGIRQKGARASGQPMNRVQVQATSNRAAPATTT